MAKKNYVHSYRVMFEQAHDPDADILDVRRVNLIVYAKNIEEAQEKAWNTVTFDKDKYEITMVEAYNSTYYHFRRPNPCEEDF